MNKSGRTHSAILPAEAAQSKPKPTSERYLYAVGLACDILKQNGALASEAAATVSTWSPRKLYQFVKGYGWRYWSLYGRWLRR